MEILNHYVAHSDRVWVLCRFNQDPLESMFGQIINFAGSNNNMCVAQVDSGIGHIRAQRLKKVMRFNEKKSSSSISSSSLSNPVS